MTDLATLALSEIGQFLCSKHGTLADAACAYLQRLKEPPRFGAIAVAGHKRCDQPYQFDLVLVIKTLDAGPHAGVLKPLKAAIGGDERIHLIEGTVSCAEMNGLLATADVFVSLHRSERVRLWPRRGLVARQARDRHRLFRQYRLPQRQHRLSRALRARTSGRGGIS